MRECHSAVVHMTWLGGGKKRDTRETVTPAAHRIPTTATYQFICNLLHVHVRLLPALELPGTAASGDCSWYR